jgi:hypothetical protein
MKVDGKKEFFGYLWLQLLSQRAFRKAPKRNSGFVKGITDYFLIIGSTKALSISDPDHEC